MKIIIVIPAYNAMGTIGDVFERISIPHNEIIVVDDGSTDMTSEIVEKHNVTLIEHEKNRGYGAAQKTGFKEALKHNADIVALVHADGQYAPEELPKLIKPIEEGEADVVLGYRTDMLEGGMPLSRFIGNKILTAMENLVLGMGLKEYHTGYRVYSRKALESIRFDLNSDWFDFDSEILVQCKLANLRIREVPTPCKYGEEISYLSSWKYGLKILKILVKYMKMETTELLWKLGLYPEDRCPRCGNELMPSGYTEFEQYFKCKDCGFGNE